MYDLLAAGVHAHGRPPVSSEDLKSLASSPVRLRAGATGRRQCRWIGTSGSGWTSALHVHLNPKLSPPATRTPISCTRSIESCQAETSYHNWSSPVIATGRSSDPPPQVATRHLPLAIAFHLHFSSPEHFICTSTLHARLSSYHDVHPRVGELLLSLTT